jgi:hypothetical protein
MRTPKILFLVLLPFAPLACSVEGEPETAEDADRQPLGKADAVGSCQTESGDLCGGPSKGNCWCDDLCHVYGDCCADKVDTCDGPADGPTLCLHEDHCGSDQACDHSECLSNCPPDMFCPAVCWGQCVDLPDPDPAPTLCMHDDHCAADEACDHSECLSNCPPDMFCPAVCWGQCLPAAPAPGPSCAGHCDGPAHGFACWCDDHCEAFGDCCDDYAEACGDETDACAAIEAAFLTEAAAIRSCTVDAECGQVLPGTSCGCTRNWVARLDADASTFDGIVEQANEAGCMLPGTISTCDCPPADGFRCDAGVCGWNYTAF